MTPEELVSLYRALPIDTLVRTDSGQTQIKNNFRVIVECKRYISGLNSYTQGVRGAVRKYLAAMAKISGSGVTTNGEGWALNSLDLDPIPLITDLNVTHALSGKGTPREIQNTGRILSLMLPDPEHSKKLCGAGSITELASWFFGMDCNGFTGVYQVLEGDSTNAKLPNIACKHQISGKELRASLTDIQDLDLVFNTGSPDHIAIINSVTSRKPDLIECTICEARDPKFGGAQTNEWKILKAKSGWHLYRQFEGKSVGVDPRIADKIVSYY